MEQPDRILHKIYQAAGDAELWPNVCDDISEFVGGGSVHLLLASLETGDKYVNLFARGDPRMADEYLHDYASMDFRAPRVMSRTLGTFVDEREYVSEVEARASVIHQELLPRYDIHKISGSNMSLDGCIGWFGITIASRRGNPAKTCGRDDSLSGCPSPQIGRGLPVARPAWLRTPPCILPRAS